MAEGRNIGRGIAAGLTAPPTRPGVVGSKSHGRWRLDQAASGAWLKGWISAAKGLTNPKRRIGAAHATLAGVTTVAMLVACLIG